MNHYDLFSGRFGMAMWQPKMDIVGQTVMYGAVKALEEAIEKDAEQRAREMVYAYLMEGGDPEVLLADISKFMESEKDE